MSLEKIESNKFVERTPTARYTPAGYITFTIALRHDELSIALPKFYEMRYSGRAIAENDVNNMNRILSLIRTIASMTFMYVYETKKEDFKNELNYIYEHLLALNDAFRHNKRYNLPKDFIPRFSELIDLFYECAMYSNVYIPTDYRKTAKNDSWNI